MILFSITNNIKLLFFNNIKLIRGVEINIGNNKYFINYNSKYFKILFIYIIKMFIININILNKFLIFLLKILIKVIYLFL